MKWRVSLAPLRGGRYARSTEPLSQIGLNEFIVIQVRVGSANPVDFFALARRKFHVRIQAERIRHQTLAAKDFMNAGDAAGKTIRGIEECRVAIRHLGRPRKQFRRDLTHGPGSLALCE